MLEAAEVPHVVLNAKNDAEEAAIIAEAGVPETVTVSTQMAGRGTDIRLGGRDGVARTSERADRAGRSVRRSVPVCTPRAGWTTSCAAAPDVRVTRVARCSSRASADELVTRYSVTSGLRPSPDKDGRLTDRKAVGTLEHAQRVADGANAELLRTTWSYTA